MAFSNYIVYVDESGDPNLEKINPHFPVFVLSFCVFEKESYAKKVIPALSLGTIWLFYMKGIYESRLERLKACATKMNF